MLRLTLARPGNLIPGIRVASRSLELFQEGANIYKTLDKNMGAMATISDAYPLLMASSLAITFAKMLFRLKTITPPLCRN